MKRKTSLFLLIFLIILLILITITYYIKEKKMQNQEPNGILYQSEFFWGPCPSDEFDCYEIIQLNHSGNLKVIPSNYETILNRESLEEIKDIIRNSNILDKNCKTDDDVMDLNGGYIINLDNKRQHFDFPGCEEEIAPINEAVNKYLLYENS